MKKDTVTDGIQEVNMPVIRYAYSKENVLSGWTECSLEEAKDKLWEGFVVKRYWLENSIERGVCISQAQEVR